MKLKPCPFCGGEAEFCRKPIKTNGGWCDAVYVWCPTCEARSNRVLYNAKVHQNDGEYIEAAEAWNRREPIDKIVEQLEENNCYVEDGDGHAGHFVFTETAIEIVKGGAE